MSELYDDESRWNDPLFIWCAIGLVCLLAAVGNIMIWLLLRDSGEAAEPSATSSQQTQVQQQQPGGSSATGPAPQQPSDAAPQQEVGAGADACVQRWHQQVAPLRAAEQAIDQWRTHVTAMNKLVSGEISLAQANKFWDQTRIGAQHHIMQFEQSASRFHESAPTCTRAATGSTASGDSIRCLHSVHVGDRLLGIAEEAIHTWKHHVRDMELLRRGEISPERAMRMWDESWHEGNRQLLHYDAANRAAALARCS